MELAAAICAAWSRCIELTHDLRPGEELVLEAVLGNDPGEIDLARHRGALAATDLVTVLDALSPMVTTGAIARQQDHLLMLHAAALADPASGATVLLVGESGAGKTTAAATLGAHLGYLSDETAGIRLDHSMVAYPKPLSMRRDAAAPKEQVSPADAGLLSPPASCHVAGLLLLARDPDHVGDAVVEDVPMVQALVALATQTSFLSRQRRPLHRLAALVEAASGARRVRYRDSADLLPVVLHTLEVQ